MKAILHIGQHKTGSTFLQHSLLNNDENLYESGIIYYPSPDKHKFRKEFENLENLDQTVKEYIGNKKPKAVIFSDENMFDRYSENELELIITKLKKTFTELEIIVYLRIQEEHMVSQYMQKTKGQMKLSLKEFISECIKSDYHYYSKMLSRFNKYEVPLHVRTYGTLLNDNIVDDFLSTCKLKISKLMLFDNELIRNHSLTADTCELFRILNMIYKKTDNLAIQKLKNRIKKKAKNESRKETKFQLNMDDRLLIYDTFYASNLSLCKEHNLTEADELYLTAKPLDTGSKPLYNEDIDKSDLVSLLLKNDLNINL